MALLHGILVLALTLSLPGTVLAALSAPNGNEIGSHDAKTQAILLTTGSDKPRHPPKWIKEQLSRIHHLSLTPARDPNNRPTVAIRSVHKGKANRLETRGCFSCLSRQRGSQVSQSEQHHVSPHGTPERPGPRPSSSLRELEPNLAHYSPDQTSSSSEISRARPSSSLLPEREPASTHSSPSQRFEGFGPDSEDWISGITWPAGTHMLIVGSPPRNRGLFGRLFSSASRNSPQRYGRPHYDTIDSLDGTWEMIRASMSRQQNTDPGIAGNIREH